MNNKLAVGIIIALVLLVGGGVWAWSANVLSNPIAHYVMPSQKSQKGTMYVSIKDAAINMGNVSEVSMVVDKIYLHSEEQGWVTMLQDSKEFPLLKLKSQNNMALAVKADVAAGAYDQIWLHIDKVTVTESGKKKEATLPSSDVKVNTYIKVVENASTSAIIDVVADESLHKTAKGEIIFTPVVVVETRSKTTVTVNDNNMVQVDGGTVDSNMAVGMDVNGDMKNNFKLAQDIELEIATGTVRMKESETK